MPLNQATTPQSAIYTAGESLEVLDYPSGAALMLNPMALQALDWSLDTTYFLYFEELDMLGRLLEQGPVLVFPSRPTPRAFIWRGPQPVAVTVIMTAVPAANFISIAAKSSFTANIFHPSCPGWGCFIWAFCRNVSFECNGPKPRRCGKATFGRKFASPTRPRRGVRVVEGARLESVYTGNRIEGSNPSLSAS